MTIIVGLTGSIAMGKSTVAAMLRRDRYRVHDSDARVHRLLATGGAAVAPVLAAFPDVDDGKDGISRQKLGARVFADIADLRRLEKILHPLVKDEQRRFLNFCRRQHVAMAILDIPLLYEGGGDRRCDAVIVVSAPGFLQKQRALRRPGMTESRFYATLGQQMPDRDKRRRATHIIDSGLGKRAGLCQLRRAIKSIKSGYKHGRRRRISL